MMLATTPTTPTRPTSHELEKSWTGNPFLNQTETWSERLTQEWYKFLDYTDVSLYIQNYCDFDAYFFEGDPLFTTDRVYYNKITKKIVSESHSSNYFVADFFREETLSDMTEEEMIEEYTSVGFKLIQQTSVGVTLQRMDHSEAGKHLYHMEDRRALQLRI